MAWKEAIRCIQLSCDLLWLVKAVKWYLQRASTLMDHWPCPMDKACDRSCHCVVTWSSHPDRSPYDVLSGQNHHLAIKLLLTRRELVKITFFMVWVFLFSFYIFWQCITSGKRLVHFEDSHILFGGERMWEKALVPSTWIHDALQSS